MTPVPRPMFGEQQRFMLFLIAPAALLLALFQVLPIVIGANASFSHLTLPMLRPVIVVCVVIRAIDAFRTFDIVWTLTGGGPGRSTELFSLYAYVLAFLNLDLGRGSAAAVLWDRRT